MLLDTYELAGLVDRLLEIAGEDALRLATLLDAIDDELRQELLRSDFLNALQVFVFFFREEPTSLGAERLVLHAAGDTARGIVFEERDIYELAFLTAGNTAVIEIRAGDERIATFEGESAYRGALHYIDEMP
jgi:hypothetical protein